MRKSHRSRLRTGGFTLIEGIIVFAVMAILFSVGLVGFRGFSNPLENQYAELISLVRMARIKAMQNTAAYRLNASGSTISVQRASNCNATVWSTDTSIGRDLGGGIRGLQLGEGVTMSPTTWVICFNSRGTLGSNSNLSLTLSRAGQTRSMQVLLGGGVVKQ
ncbi:GspH/FimT family pseudopilin [Meiothermus sp. CFH 77666]|uniref:GspH/FimT family pseudopilin n=1 Tax=Meiothermus sp. CFH 77666 TaxID=2817942 RepID=UPI001AA0AB81|nr:GspH/FimT family pseudopilin [Meiothermus sp. CFH 77666]MBO1438075.1 GspH/FimT family pseudopilin [Meiothermus sp. CFH 77666]